MKNYWLLEVSFKDKTFYFVEDDESYRFTHKLELGKMWESEHNAKWYLSELQRLNPKIEIFKHLQVRQHKIDMRH